MSQGQTQTHKTHHGPNLGEAITFPLIVYSMPGHETNTQMSWESEIPKIGTLATLETHNFVCRSPSEMTSEAKLYTNPIAYNANLISSLLARGCNSLIHLKGEP